MAVAGLSVGTHAARRSPVTRVTRVHKHLLVSTDNVVRVYDRTPESKACVSSRVICLI